MHLLLGPPPPPEYQKDVGDLLGVLDLEPGEDPLLQAIETERAERHADAAADHEQVAVADLASEEEREGIARGAGTVRETAAVLQQWQQIVDAPNSLAELYEAYPPAREMVRALRGLDVFIDDEELREESYWDRNSGLAFTFFKPYREISDPAIMRRISARGEQSRAQTRRQRLGEILGVAAGDPAGEALVAYLQKRVLREVYKNDPDQIVTLIRKYGPIDWRMVDAQSIYWGTEALTRAEGMPNVFENDKTNMMRIILFSLQNLTRANEMFFEPNHERVWASYLNMMPDPSFIDAMNEAYLVYGKIDARNEEGPGAGRLFKSGHVNFLSEGIRTLYFAGRMEEAQRYYDYLRETYGRRPNGVLEDRYQGTLDEYVRLSYQDVKGLRREAIRTIRGMTFGAIQALANGDVDQATGLAEQAEFMWETYMAEQDSGTFTRLHLPPLRDMFIDAFRAYLRLPMDPVHKFRVWANTPNAIKLRIYDDLLPIFQREAEAFALDLSRAFPPPIGIETYRAENPGRSGELDEPGRSDENAPDVRTFRNPGA